MNKVRTMEAKLIKSCSDIKLSFILRRVYTLTSEKMQSDFEAERSETEALSPRAFTSIKSLLIPPFLLKFPAGHAE